MRVPVRNTLTSTVIVGIVVSVCTIVAHETASATGGPPGPPSSRPSSPQHGHGSGRAPYGYHHGSPEEPPPSYSDYQQVPPSLPDAGTSRLPSYEEAVRIRPATPPSPSRLSHLFHVFPKLHEANTALHSRAHDPTFWQALAIHSALTNDRPTSARELYRLNRAVPVERLRQTYSFAGREAQPVNLQPLQELSPQFRLAEGKFALLWYPRQGDTEYALLAKKNSTYHLFDPETKDDLNVTEKFPGAVPLGWIIPL